MSKKCKAFSQSYLGLEEPNNRKAFYNGWDAAMQQREWIGLTDHDIHQLRQQGAHSVSDKEFRAIEAKLKEKNT